MRKYSAPKPNTVRSTLYLAANSKMTSSTVTAPRDGWVVDRTYTIAETMAYTVLDFYNIPYPGDAAVADISVDEVVMVDVPTGAATRALFSGAQNLSLPAGTRHAVSDVIHAGMLGLATFTKGRQVRIKMRGTCTQSGGFPTCTISQTMIFYDKATCTVNSLLSSAAITVTGANQTTSNGVYEPVIVGLRNSASSPAAVMAVGDSLLDNSEPSYIQRSGTTNGIAVLEMSKGGMTQGNLSSDTSWTSYLRYVNVLIDDMGTNASTDTTSFAGYWNIAKNTFGYPVYHVGLYPRASASSDSYTTISGQTIFPGWSPPGVEPYFDARVADGTLAGQFRPASIRDAATNKWAVDGTSFKYTGDGTHPTAFADELVKVEFDPVFAGWMSGRLAPTT